MGMSLRDELNSWSQLEANLEIHWPSPSSFRPTRGLERAVPYPWPWASQSGPPGFLSLALPRPASEKELHGHPHVAEALTLGIYPAVLGNPAGSEQQRDSQRILPKQSPKTWEQSCPYSKKADWRSKRHLGLQRTGIICPGWAWEGSGIPSYHLIRKFLPGPRIPEHGLGAVWIPKEPGWGLA